MRSVKVLLALVVGVVSFGVVPGGADHGAGSISGTVTDVALQPLEHICIYLYEVEDYGDDYWDYYTVGWGHTGADGTYHFDGLHDAAYLVSFDDCEEGRYLHEWYDDAEWAWDATWIDIVDEATVTGIDAILGEGGEITGTVTDQGTGDPIAGVCVMAEGDDTGSWQYDWTGEDGTYSLDGLRTGNYAVHFGCEDYFYYSPNPSGAVTPLDHEWGGPSPWIPEWYDGHDFRDTADLVPVAEGVTTPMIDASLVFGGTIGGQIHGLPSRGHGICVELYEVATERWLRWTYTYSGYWSIPGLRAGDYKVSFYDCDDGRYAGEFYNDKTSFADADLVNVTLGEWTDGIDATLTLRPVPDLAVTDLTVTRVPISTDAAELPGAGLQRGVSVEVTNVGQEVADYGELHVSVVMTGDGTRRHLGTVRLHDMGAGEALRKTFRWDATGSFGDARVEVEICPAYGEWNHQNNSASADSYAIVGGTGIGMTPGGIRDPYWPECDWWYWD